MRFHELHSRGSTGFSTGGALMMRRKKRSRPIGRREPKKVSKKSKKEIADVIKHFTRNNRKISRPDALQVVVRGRPKANYNKRRSVQDYVERNVSPPKSKAKRRRLNNTISDVVKGKHSHDEIVEKLSKKRARDSDDPLRRYEDPRGVPAKKTKTHLGENLIDRPGKVGRKRAREDGPDPRPMKRKRTDISHMESLNGPEKQLDESHWDDDDPRKPVKPRSPTTFTPPSTPKPMPSVSSPKTETASEKLERFQNIAGYGPEPEELAPIMSGEPSNPVNTEMQSFLEDQRRMNEQFQKTQDDQRATIDSGMTFTSTDDFSEHPKLAFETPLPTSPKADVPMIQIPEETVDVPMTVASPRVTSPKLQLTQNEPISIGSEPPAQFTFNPTETETDAQRLERFRQLAGYSGEVEEPTIVAEPLTRAVGEPQTIVSAGDDGPPGGWGPPDGPTGWTSIPRRTLLRKSQ